MVSINEENLGVWRRLQGRGIGAVLARGASGSFGVMVIGVGIAFGANMLLTRLMGAAQYGIYIYALTWTNILALICQLGLSASLLRYAALYNATGEWGLLRGLFILSTKYVLFASLVVAVLSSLVVYLIKDELASDQVMTFLLAFLLLPFLGLNSLRISALRAFKLVVKASLPDTVFRPLIIVFLSVVVWIISERRLEAPQVMGFGLAAVLIAFLVGINWLLKALPPKIKISTPVFSQTEWLKVSLPLFFVGGLHLVLSQTDVLMIGALIGSKQAGIYAVASRIAGLLAIGLTAANTIVAPMISELYGTDNRQQLQRLITLSVRGVFVFTVLIFAFLVLQGRILLNLFGPEFSIGYSPLLILLIGQLINALAGSVGFLMTMTGHQTQALWIVGANTMLNIVLNGVLITMFGMIGAAMATAVTTALWNIMMLIFVFRRLNINPTVFAR
jgi:O-antigen/teichoic acid export membrane protein